MIVFLKDKNQKHSTMGECRKESHSYSTYLDLFFIRMDRYFSVLRLCIVFHLTRCLPHAFKISHIIHSLNHQEIRVEKSNFESLLFIYLFYHKKKKVAVGPSCGFIAANYARLTIHVSWIYVAMDDFAQLKKSMWVRKKIKIKNKSSGS